MSVLATARRLRTARPRPAVLVDAAIAVAAFAGTLATLRHGGVFPIRPDWQHLDLTGFVLAACSSLPLLAWRHHPLGVFTSTAAASVATAGHGYPIDGLLGTLGPATALYLLAAGRTQRAPWTGRTSVIVVGMLLLCLAATLATQRQFPLHIGPVWAGAWFAAERTRLRREQMADLRDRAVRAERDAERERRLAVAEERTRIARDLHDSAGHAMSVIAVRAGAARLRHHQDPDRSLVALRTVEDLARRTVEEIDRLVGSLRGADPAGPPLEAPAGLASLDTLITHHACTGLTITNQTTGRARPLGGAADQAAYRILQEALTNAARHGTASADIHVSYADDAVELTITNPIRTDSAPRPGGGHGLIGMRERATLLGGTLHTERAATAFRVCARIPYESGHA